MKTIRNFFCNTDPVGLAIGGLAILFFGGILSVAAYHGKFLEILGVMGISVGTCMVFFLVFGGSYLLIRWLQSYCKEK